jgi:site-specific recombinase XerD
MRHSLGAHLARCKVSEHLIAGILGHRLAAVSITQRYMRPHGPDLLEAIRWAWREP